ncbi:cytoplasmic dynein-like protein 1 intermediate chain 2 [Microdochium bolleyi]|uniref:Cytoplasmic dynein-like protein 1 intermediate chain 2 n=1 Tax=Microdochium bolleyi TaxID=196109 RepID=A0A136J4G5_9PEZI|nr:cytoplasmic dynein-like protein 1 intermediate chain 2 [Microdochium bolleyi]
MMQQQRRDEILAKKAKLAELKRQRELRANQATAGRISIGGPGDIISPTPSRADSRKEIERILNDLVPEGRPVSSSSPGVASPGRGGSRPHSILSAGELSAENSESASQAYLGPPEQAVPVRPLPELSTAPVFTLYECPPSPVKEVFSYSKGVQTTDEWTPPTPRNRAISELPDEDVVASAATPSKRLSRRDQRREEELRQNLRKEIEEELREARDLVADGPLQSGTVSTTNFPARALTDEELVAVTASDDFVDFVERSTKVIERALDISNEYDILTNYSLQALDIEDEDEQAGNTGGKGRRRVKEVMQFYDERWSKKRMISSLDFSPKFPELLLASYTKNPSAPHDPDGVVQLWNQHLQDRPEFLFHAQSDVLTAKFSPFHPNLIIGGTYSGQVLLWDTRAKSAPVQKTPLTGSGHSHPVYSIDIVGTQNANNIISVSTDGALCVWSVDMLSQPQESLTLTAPPPHKFEDLAPTCVAFPQSDPTYFLAGSEEGSIYPCHRYDRAGAKAGVDRRISYKGHAAPVMSVNFHPARGPVDLGDLVLSSSLDWSVKMWKVRAPAATSTIVESLSGASVSPLCEFVREDVVYDAAWSPVRPGVFALVDGAGALEVWDITVETEIPVAKITPSPGKDSQRYGNYLRSLNKVAWDQAEGKRLATGGIEGVVSVFEVGPDLGGKEGARAEEWTNVKKFVARLEALNAGASGVV